MLFAMISKPSCRHPLWANVLYPEGQCWKNQTQHDNHPWAVHLVANELDEMWHPVELEDAQQLKSADSNRGHADEGAD
jgi:hypothetical protein